MAFYINYLSLSLATYHFTQEDLRNDRKTRVSFASFNRLFNEDKIGKSMTVS